MTAAGSHRAALLSTAYWFASSAEAGDNEIQRVQAENDWTINQAARFPNRLAAFVA